MKLTDWMDRNGFCVGITLKEKDGVIDILAALQQKCGNTDRSKQLKRDIYYREEEAPAAIGAGAAIFNVRSKAVRRPLITAVTAPDGVDLDAPDGEKSRLIFLAALPPEEEQEPVSRLTVLLMNEDLREQLAEAADEETFLQLLKMAEEGDYTAPQPPGQEMPLILLAANEWPEAANEAAAQLQLAAGRLGVLLKMERQGGPVFSQEDLREAKGVLLLGEELPAERFDGKPVLKINAADGIHRPEHLLRAVQQAPVFHKRILRKPKKPRLSDWYFRTRVPLLPMLLLAGGVFLLIGKGLAFFSLAAAEVFFTIGKGAFSLIAPLISGMIAFRYARWPGLAVGLAGGVMLDQSCGGVWAALLGGMLAGVLMRGAENGLQRLPGCRRAVEWSLPVIGTGLLGCFALVAGQLASRMQGAVALFFGRVEDPRLRGLFAGGVSALDPAGPLAQAVYAQRADPSLHAALAAAGLAVALGVAVFLLLHRRETESERRISGLAAMPAALGGYMSGWLVFYAGDPFRIALAASLGAGAAGLISAALGCATDTDGIFAFFSGSRLPGLLLATVCGGAVVCSMLMLLEKTPKNRSHEVKKIKK